LDPNSDEGADGAEGDPDDDGLTNWQEYQAGTHPNDASSYLRVESISGDGGEARIRFRVVAGKSYSVLHRAAAASGPWQKLVDLPVQAQSVEIEVTDPGAGTAGERFYRVVTPQQ
jgi:hypothetical protein